MPTLRQKIAQMLIMGFEGTTLNPELSDDLSELGLGGVIVFDQRLHHPDQHKNLVTIEQIKQLTTDIRTAASTQHLPPWIAIDYEGGAVDRLKNIPGCPQTLTPAEFATLSPDDLWQEASKMAKTLSNLGFNLNFAPLVDLALDTSEGIIGKLGRSFSADPERVAEIARLFVEASFEAGVACCYKHFPGHGSAKGDTHLGLVDVSETFQPDELIPYRRLLADQTLPAMVMTAHVVNRKLDPTGLPATLSRPILKGLLRDEIGFQGVIISDDLQMRALSSHYALDDMLLQTIHAGADMMIFGNQWGHHTAREVIDKIEQHVSSGKISMARIDEAYQRIAALKGSVGRTCATIPPIPEAT